MFARLCIAVVTGVASLLHLDPVAAQDSTFPSPVDAGGALESAVVDEDLRQSPQVSGVRVLGYSTLPAAGQDRPSFTVHVPRDWPGGPACLRVQTADALYEATTEVILPVERADSLVPIFYRSRYDDTFWQTRAGELSDDGLAVLISQGDCGTARPGIAPTLPVVGGDGSQTLPVILLNTFRAESGFVNVKGSQDTTACELIDAPVQTAYDMRCSISLASDTRGPVTVTVWPVKGGELGLPIEVTLWAFP